MGCADEQFEGDLQLVTTLTGIALRIGIVGLLLVPARDAGSLVFVSGITAAFMCAVCRDVYFSLKQTQHEVPSPRSSRCHRRCLLRDGGVAVLAAGLYGWSDYLLFMPLVNLAAVHPHRLHRNNNRRKAQISRTLSS